MKKKAEEIVYDIAFPITQKHNFELVEVEYKKEGPDWFLRIYIDKEGGISVDDCQLVSEEMNPLLDEIDPIDDAYFFEVSSPGIERPLKLPRDFEKNMNKMIEVKFFTPYEGKKAIEGILMGYTENEVQITVGKNDITIDRKLISIMKPVIIFNN